MRILGKVVMGLLRKNSGSTYAHILCSLSPQEIQEIFGFAQTVLRKGSNVYMKISGDNGHPCLVLFVIEKEEESTTFRQPHTQGFE